MALYHLMQDKNYSVEYLLTSVNIHHNRVSMHGLRTELLQEQLNAIGIPSGRIELPEHVTNPEYEKQITQKVIQLKARGFNYAAFGDIFLEDLRKYREQQLETVNIQAIFPLWKRDTRTLLNEFIDLGFKTVVVCVDANKLNRSFAGRIIDENFINDLPKDVDPCGENGEFHTFCFDAPFFQHPIKYSIGETVLKEYSNNGSKQGFWFCDLLPVNEQAQL